MRRLLPDPADPVDLAEAYAYPDDGPWLRANMVASADGAATASGRSEGLSGPADRRVFGLLRALADVVVVGATTVRREGYGPAKARPEYAERRAASGQPPAPVIAVVSRSLELDFSAPLFTASEPRTIVVTVDGGLASDGGGERLAAARASADVIVAGTGRVDLRAALDALVVRGHRRMLTEGGPHLLGELTAAGRLDELCLTVSPRLTGGDSMRILTGVSLERQQRLRLGHLLAEDDFLFARYLLDPGTS